MLLLDPAQRPVIGHRGNRAHAPENTIESFRQAQALGADAIEFDVHLSRDGVPVVHHDATLDRTTDASGPIRALTAGALAQVDAGFRFSPDGGQSFPYRGRGLGIPTLASVLEALPRIPLIVEMKSVEAAGPSLRVLREAQALGRVLVGSFLDAAVEPFAAAGVPVSPGVGTLKRRYVPALFGSRPRVLPFQALCLPRAYRGLPVPIGRFAAMMRAAGGPTHVWTINDPAVARRLWARGVAGIISDDPGLMLRTRAEAA